MFYFRKYGRKEKKPKIVIIRKKDFIVKKIDYDANFWCCLWQYKGYNFLGFFVGSGGNKKCLKYGMECLKKELKERNIKFKEVEK